jgi:hypothetical protein
MPFATLETRTDDWVEQGRGDLPGRFAAVLE